METLSILPTVPTERLRSGEGSFESEMCLCPGQEWTRAKQGGYRGCRAQQAFIDKERLDPTLAFFSAMIPNKRCHLESTAILALHPSSLPKECIHSGPVAPTLPSSPKSKGTYAYTSTFPPTPTEALPIPYFLTQPAYSGARTSSHVQDNW
jgi:hypothetical protein